MSRCELSIILPIHNQAAKIGKNLDRLIEGLKRLRCTYEIICVDDESKDATVQEIRLKAKKIHSIKLIANPINQGKALTIKNGLDAAGGRYTIFTDGDFAYSIASILSVYEELKKENYDFVSANRRDSRSSFTVDQTMFKYLNKRFKMSGIFNKIVDILFAMNIADTQSGLKGFKTEVAKKLFDRLTITNFAFDVELFFRATKWNLRMCEIPCHVLYPFEPSTMSLIQDSFTMFLSLLRLRIRGN